MSMSPAAQTALLILLSSSSFVRKFSSRGLAPPNMLACLLPLAKEFTGSEIVLGASFSFGRAANSSVIYRDMERYKN